MGDAVQGLGLPESPSMLKTAAGIAGCLMLAAAAEAVKSTGMLAPLAAGALGAVAGVAINFGHEFCKRFGERASAYGEKIWGLDKNEHIGRGVRRAQIAATREVLLVWNQARPPFDDHGRALAGLLSDWCEEQGKDNSVARWA